MCNMKKYIVSSLLLLSLIVPGVSFGQEDVDPNPNNLECTSLTSINLRYRSRDIATNGQVSDLQDFLQSKGYLNSEPTGYFGLMTFQAVKSFQSANGISPTGYVGPLTRGKIASQSCGNENTVVYNEFKSEPRPDLRPVAPKTDARGCAPGAVFSSTTGEPCNKNLPVGCSSTSGFSLTTGVPCNSKGIGQPSVNVKVNGLGGAVQVVKGGFVYINWTSENTYSCSATGSSWDDVRSQLSQELTTSGYITVTPQQSAEYTIACRGENKTVSDSVTVKVIANNDTSTCSSSGFDSRTGLRCGCSSTSGFSLTTGIPCNYNNSNTATDNLIKEFLKNSRAQAVLYWDRFGSYAGVCTNEGGVYSLINSAAKTLSPSNVVGYNGIPFSYSQNDTSGAAVCHDSPNAWAAIVSLKNPSTSGGGWCVDSTGVSREATSLGSTSTRCE